LSGDSGRLDESTLFLACTRPAMFLGVPMEAMGVNIIATMSLQTVLGVQWLLAGVLIHVVFRAVVRNDHNAFSVLSAWLDTVGRSRNTRIWGGFSLTPAPLVRHYDERDLGND
jgi:type IV secretion system protein VirB3